MPFVSLKRGHLPKPTLSITAPLDKLWVLNPELPQVIGDPSRQDRSYRILGAMISSLKTLHFGEHLARAIGG
jgi:hypothetical protein